MRVAVVLSGVTASEVPHDLWETIRELSSRHTVDLWAPPRAYRQALRRVPQAHAVHHADKREETLARRRRPRLPQSLRPATLSSQRVGVVLRELDTDLILVPDHATWKLAHSNSAESVAVMQWSPSVPPLSSQAEQPHGAGAITVGAVGPLVKSARFGDAIRAFDQATSGRDDAHLVVRGSGKHEPFLHDLIAWRGLETRVNVEPVGADTLVLNDLHVLLMPSPHPQPPLLALAAASAGVPVVGFDHDPVVVALAAARAAYVVPSGSLGGMSSALRYLLDDPQARESLAARAQEAANSVCSQPVAQMWAAVVDLIGERKDGRAQSTQAAPSTPASLLVDVRQCLNANGIPFGVVEGESGTDVLVVAHTDQAAVAQALTSVAVGPGSFIEVWAGDDLAWSRPVTEPADYPEFLACTDRFRVVASDGNAVDVELWTQDQHRVFHAPRRNREAEQVDAPTWHDWMQRPGQTVSGKPLWDQVRFPIDAVFTWVDGSDPDWQAKRAAYLPTGTSEKQEVASISLGAHDSRFVSRDEIYYAVASAVRNLPWLRRIIVVSDGQRHDRILRDFPHVEFVDHAEVFPDPAVLPVFNSHAIETVLHHLDGLAEHFIYFNDDVLVTQPLTPQDFFEPNGVAKFFPSPRHINFDHSDGTEPHVLAAARNREIMLNDCGVEITNFMLHTPHPHTRSVLVELEDRYESEFTSTRAQRFRSGTDISLLASLAQYYGWVQQKYTRGSLRYRFVRLHAHELEKRLDQAAGDGDVQVIALGEPHEGQARHPHEAALVERFLDRLLG